MKVFIIEFRGRAAQNEHTAALALEMLGHTVVLTPDDGPVLRALLDCNAWTVLPGYESSAANRVLVETAQCLSRVRYFDLYDIDPTSPIPPVTLPVVRKIVMNSTYGKGPEYRTHIGCPSFPHTPDQCDSYRASVAPTSIVRGEN